MQRELAISGDTKYTVEHTIRVILDILDMLHVVIYE